jgi:hypothetical protein
MTATEQAAEDESRAAIQESVRQNVRVQQKSRELITLLNPNSKERIGSTGKDYSRKLGRVLREKAIAIIGMFYADTTNIGVHSRMLAEFKS